LVQKNTNQFVLAKKSFKKAKRGSYEAAAKYEIREINFKLRQSGDAAGEEPEEDKTTEKEGEATDK
jgi:hypothetical protein